MRTRKIIILGALAGSFLLGVARAQTTNCWVIVNGPGAGTELVAVDGIVVDVLSGHTGSLALGHFTDCQCTGHAGHYHGFLFGVDDPDSRVRRRAKCPAGPASPPAAADSPCCRNGRPR